jgi:hypothetical protein
MPIPYLSRYEGDRGLCDVLEAAEEAGLPGVAAIGVDAGRVRLGAAAADGDPNCQQRRESGESECCFHGIPPFV